MAKNAVVAGDFQGKMVLKTYNGVAIATSITKRIDLTKETVESYEVVDESSRKSAVSAVGRGLVGGFLVGPAGLLAGLTAKSKGTHVIALQFKDGKKSLLEVDQKIYSSLVKCLF